MSGGIKVLIQNMPKDLPPGHYNVWLDKVSEPNSNNEIYVECTFLSITEKEWELLK